MRNRKKATRSALTGFSKAFPLTGGDPLVVVPPGVGVTPKASIKKKAPPTTKSTSKLIRLDLGSGQSPRDGFAGVDVVDAPGISHVVNLWQFPWPWADNSVDEIHTSHFIEHIPMEYVSDAHTVHGKLNPHLGKDLLLAFFDECFRVLKHNGLMTVVVPCARSNRAFQDPTHRRFIVAETFCYLSADWRKFNKLDHYKVECNFIGNVTPTMGPEELAKSFEDQNMRSNHLWNTVLDWHCNLMAIKAPII